MDHITGHAIGDHQAMSLHIALEKAEIARNQTEIVAELASSEGKRDFRCALTAAAPLDRIVSVRYPALSGR
jgi:hypothetical protein